MYKTRILIRFASGQSIVSVFGTLFAQKTERNDGRQIDSKSRNKFTGDTSAIQWNLILNCALRKFRVFYFDQSKNFVSFLMHDAQTHIHTHTPYTLFERRLQFETFEVNKSNNYNSLKVDSENWHSSAEKWKRIYFLK